MKRMGLGFLAILLLGMIVGAAEASVGQTLKSVTMPDSPGNSANCAFEGADFGTAVTIVPGGKAGFPKIPILLVTSCNVFGEGTAAVLFFIDPSTATVVKTLTTSVTPDFGWQALTPRADQGDLMGCGAVLGVTGL